MSDSNTFQDSLLVLSHVEVKAAEVGGGVGLLVALPGLFLAPMKANPDELPPLVAAASLAGTGALIGAAIATPPALWRLYRDGKPGVYTRAVDLRCNERQKFVDRMAMIGAVAGIALESVRIRAIARIHDLPTTTVATTRASLWELFGFAVAGAAVAAGTTTVIKLITDKVTDADATQDGKFKENASEMRELVDRTADDIRQSAEAGVTQVNQSIDEPAGVIQNETLDTTAHSAANPQQTTLGGNTGSDAIVDPNV